MTTERERMARALGWTQHRYRLGRSDHYDEEWLLPNGEVYGDLPPFEHARQPDDTFDEWRDRCRAVVAGEVAAWPFHIHTRRMT